MGTRVRGKGGRVEKGNRSGNEEEKGKMGNGGIKKETELGTRGEREKGEWREVCQLLLLRVVPLAAASSLPLIQLLKTPPSVDVTLP